MDMIASAIGGLLGRSAVIAEAVRLDHESQLGPVEVDAEPVELLLGQRNGQSSPADQTQEASLELGVGEGERAAVEDLAERGRAPHTRSLLDDLPKPLRINQSEGVCLIDSGLECAAIDLRRQIDQCSSWGRHRDPVAAGPIRVLKVGAPMSPHPGSAPSDGLGKRNIDQGRGAQLGSIAGGLSGASDSPELRCAGVAQKSLIAACEDSSHPPPSRRELRAPNCINAAMNGMQTAAIQTMANPAGCQAHLNQLSPSDHAMLVPGQLPGRSTGISEPLCRHGAQRLRNSEVAPLPRRLSSRLHQRTCPSHPAAPAALQLFPSRS